MTEQEAGREHQTDSEYTIKDLMMDQLQVWSEKKVKANCKIFDLRNSKKDVATYRNRGKCEKVRFDLKNKQAKETKANKQMGLPQTKKYSKENYQQNEKATG